MTTSKSERSSPPDLVSDTYPYQLSDNSSLDDSRRCARYYYFRHVRGWSPLRHAIELVAGTAMHAAMDIIWRGVNSGLISLGEILDTAFEAFEKPWTDEGFPSYEDFLSLTFTEQETYNLGARTPLVMRLVLQAYIQERYDFLRSIELVSVERPVIVPIDLDPLVSNRAYVGRPDKVFIKSGAYYSIDHKTTASYAKSGGFRSSWISQFSPNTQIEGYSYILRHLFGRKAKGSWIDGLLLHKQHRFFKILPFHFSIAYLEQWLWETRDRVSQIQRDKARLEAFRNSPQHLSSPIMPAFPRNTSSCNLYNRRCMYADVCEIHGNPERMPDSPPGMHIAFWDSLEHRESSVPPKTALQPSAAEG